MIKLLQKIPRTIPAEIRKDSFKDALRLALQSSISAAIAFLVMNYFDLPEAFLAVISAVLIVEPSIGDTFNQAKGRVMATIVGSIVGFIFVAVIPWGFGTAISLMVTMFLMNGIASYKPTWRYGVVAAVALALGSENSALATSVDRLIAIGVGIGIGILITSVLWPQKASSRANNYLRKALNAACERFEIAYENSTTSDKEDADNVADDFYTNLGKAKNVARVIRKGSKESVLKQIDAVEKLYNSILIINRVGINADTTLLSEDAGIENDSERFKKKACDIIKSFVNREEVSDEEIKDFDKLALRAKEDVNAKSDDKEQNMFRHAFVFGITEINDSLTTLKELLKTT